MHPQVAPDQSVKQFDHIMNRIPEKLGRYRLISEVGRGAMGVVYKAHDPVIEREVAIKAIELTFETTAQEKQIYLSRFYREAKAAGKLNHPNIVTIYDVDQDKATGTPFIVMEYLEGTNLQEIISDGILLPFDDVNHVIMQVASALSYAHKQGVVHRDIKSANILIVEQMKAKITDFGIARLPSSDLTKTGQYMGTPNYMSPEQIDGKIAVDGRSDLFSLGVIFYLLITGERPFSGDSFTSISYKIVHVDPIPPRIINPAVPDVYNRILQRLLSKDPAQRYQTGAELVAELQKIRSMPIELQDSQLKEIEEAEAAKKTNRVRNAPILPKTQPWPVLAKMRMILALSTMHAHRLSLLLIFTILITGISAAGIYLFKSPVVPKQKPSQPATQVEIVPETPDEIPVPVPIVSSSNSLWDLAMNYYRNGFYEKSTEQFHKILVNDPENESAKKYLELIEKKKSFRRGERRLTQQALPAVRKPANEPSLKKTTNSKPAGQKATTNTNHTPVQQPSKSTTAPTANNVKASESVRAAEKNGRINFEFEHSFPSGTFYIYSNGKLAFQGVLSAKKKRILVFPDYIGRLSGSVTVPKGEIELRLQAVSQEVGVSVEKRLHLQLTEGQSKNLKVKFIKISKQLETRWI